MDGLTAEQHRQLRDRYVRMIETRNCKIRELENMLSGLAEAFAKTSEPSETETALLWEIIGLAEAHFDATTEDEAELVGAEFYAHLRHARDIYGAGRPQGVRP